MRRIVATIACAVLLALPGCGAGVERIVTTPTDADHDGQYETLALTTRLVLPRARDGQLVATLSRVGDSTRALFATQVRRGAEAPSIDLERMRPAGYHVGPTRPGQWAFRLDFDGEDMRRFGVGDSCALELGFFDLAERPTALDSTAGGGFRLPQATHLKAWTRRIRIPPADQFGRNGVRLIEVSDDSTVGTPALRVRLRVYRADTLRLNAWKLTPDGSRWKFDRRARFEPGIHDETLRLARDQRTPSPSGGLQGELGEVHVLGLAPGDDTGTWWRFVDGRWSNPEAAGASDHLRDRPPAPPTAAR